MSNQRTVLLPIYNSQQSLVRAVANILETLPEWNERFELILIDDGSTDDTPEIALDLAAHFPQVRLLRHPLRLGLGEAIQTGLDESTAQYVLVGNDTYQLDLDDLRVLWRLRETVQDQSRRPSVPAAKVRTSRGATSEPTRGRVPLARLAQQLGFQYFERTTSDELRLEQAVAEIARIDAAGHVASGPTSPASLIERVKRLVRGQ
ncbi:MAG: glycosyltransferase family 2 protein [Pirellulales bacterium]